MTKEELILGHRELIIKIAKYYYGISKDFGIEFDDLFQTCCLALLEKYKNYDEDRSNTYSYASLVIKTAIINYINDNNTITHVPRNLSYLANIIQNKNIEFYQANGRYMTEEETLEIIKSIKWFNYKKTLELARMVLEINKYHLKLEQVSLNERKDEEVDEFAINYIKTSYNLEDTVISDINCNSILNTIINESRNYDIVTEILGLNDGIPKTREELATKYYTSTQFIDYKYKSILKKLKKNLE